MKSKDIIVMILCQFGFDRNIDIKFYKGFPSVYEIYATNREGDVYTAYDNGGLMDIIYDILNYMIKNKIDLSYNWYNIGSLKDL